jgi:hypothetical protein
MSIVAHELCLPLSTDFAYTGWFPDWPGGRAWLNGGLFDPDTGVTSIPKYWI